MIIKGSPLTYHAVQRKQTYAMSIGVRAMVSVRKEMLGTVSINENMVGTLSVTAEKNSTFYHILNMFF